MSSAAAPLFAKRRPRQPRAIKLPAPKEIVTHFQVKKLLDDFLRQEWLWTHLPMGEARDIHTARKLKNMGTKAGWSDFLLIAPGGRAHMLELKRVGGRLNEAQVQFQDDCLRLGVPHAVVFDVHGALNTLSTWGALRIQIRDGVPALGSAQG
jgi:hypothetical protein